MVYLDMLAVFVVNCASMCIFLQLYNKVAICVYDQLQNLSLNRVEIEEGDVKTPTAGARPKKKKKSYDLNPTDTFWQSHKGR